MKTLNYLLCIMCIYLFIGCAGDTPNPITPTSDDSIFVEVNSDSLRFAAIIDVLKYKDSIAALKRKAGNANVRRGSANITLNDLETLVFDVQLNINPRNKNWLVFQNGTYMLFKDPLGKDILLPAALKRLDALSQTSETLGNINVQKSTLAKGWIVSFGSSGVYNYVGPRQVKRRKPSDRKIAEIGNANLRADIKTKKLVHFNSPDTKTH